MSERMSCHLGAMHQMLRVKGLRLERVDRQTIDWERGVVLGAARIPWIPNKGCGVGQEIRLLGL